VKSFGEELQAVKKDDISDKVSELQGKLERMEQSPAKSPRAGSGGALARIDTLEGQMEEARSGLEACRKDVAGQKTCLDELSEAQSSSLSEALQKQVDDLSKHINKEVADIKTQLKSEVDSFEKRLGEVSISKEDGAEKKVESFQESLDKFASELKQAQDTIGKLQETPKTPKAAEAPASADVDELKSQLKALEAKMSTPSGNTEDSKLRSQVQQQVQGLTTQLSKELESLAEHQKDMIETRATVQDLAAKVAGKGTSGAGQEEAIQNLKKEINGVADRLSSLEKSSGEVRKDLEGLLGPRNKVGISMTGGESPLAEVRGRLDQLFEQVAEMQTKADDASHGASQGGSAASKSKSPKRQLPAASPEASLNFSLTEQTERPGAVGEGSLNFSLTEQTNKEMSISEPPSRRPAGLSLGGSTDEGVEVDSDDDILSTSVSPSGAGKDELAKDKGSKSGAVDAGSSGNSNLSGRPRPSPLKTEEDRPLTSVAEEVSVSDAGEPSPNSKGSGAGTRSSKSKSAVSPAGASASVESPMGGSGGLEASMMSQVSIGCDYSVDDSLELENKCDFVEVVRPVSSTAKKKAMGIAGSTIDEAGEDAEELSAKPMAQLAASTLMEAASKPANKKSPTSMNMLAGQTLMEAGSKKDALDSLMQPKVATKGGDALDSLLSKPKAKSSNIDALDSLLGGPGPGLGKPKSPAGSSKSPAGSSKSPAGSSKSPAGSSKSPAGSSKSPTVSKSPKARAKASPDKADEEPEYGSASFEDDMSVPESIEEESMEGSGSGAWASGEAV